MNGTSLLAKACAAALLCTGAAWAENAAGLIDSSKLDDKKVTDLQGSELGEVERLLVDPQSGQIRFAVIEVKTTSQPQAETEVAVPWQALKVQREGSTGDFKIQLDATKEKLERAPRFSEAEVDRLWTPEGGKQVFSYWAIIWSEPAGTQPPSGTAATPPSTSGQQPAPSTSGQQPPSSTSGTVGTPDSGQPGVSTPSDQGGTSTGPGSYYEKNRPSTESSATEQNNYPAGQQPGTPPSSVTTPESSTPSTSAPFTRPAPSTTPPTSSTSPTDTSEAKPGGASSGSTDSSTSTPPEPSTVP